MIPIWLFLLTFLVSMTATWVTLRIIIPLLAQSELTGKDFHKPDQPEIPEMGGLGIVVGISGGFILAIGAHAFLHIELDVIALLAVLATVLIVSFIGVFDDLLELSQIVKILTPLFAALPLMAIRAGTHILKIPFVGKINFGLAYPLVLIPIAITGAANAVNMLAGFNGMETGVGIVALGCLSIIALLSDSSTAFLILLVALGSLLATLYFNWYPAKVMIGDVGTLTIGAIMAASVIIGNFETAGAVIIIPYFIDFLFKACSGFPSEGWSGLYKPEDDKLHCQRRFPVSFPQFIMKITGGIKERNLTLAMMGIEGIFGLIAILLYARF